jgi:hypothetical protein
MLSIPIAGSMSSSANATCGWNHAHDTCTHKLSTFVGFNAPPKRSVEFSKEHVNDYQNAQSNRIFTTRLSGIRFDKLILLSMVLSLLLFSKRPSFNMDNSTNELSSYVSNSSSQCWKKKLRVHKYKRMLQVHTFYRAKAALPLLFRCFTSPTNPWGEILIATHAIALLVNTYLASECECY